MRRDQCKSRYLHIRWKGGPTTSMELPLPLSARDLHRTSATVVELIRALATTQTDRQIAETLNARWLRPGTGQRFTGLLVWRILPVSGRGLRLRLLRLLTRPSIACG